MDIFKSRRFISSVIGGVVMLVIAALPSLQNSESLLVEAFTVLVLALVGGYTLEDVTQPKPGRGKPAITVLKESDQGLTVRDLDRRVYDTKPLDYPKG